MEGKLGIQQAGWQPGMPLDFGGDGATVDMASASGGGGGLPGIGLPGVGDLLKPRAEAGLTPKGPQEHQGSGAAPGPAGPTFVVNGDVGMDPNRLTRRFDAKHNESYRRTVASVRP